MSQVQAKKIRQDKTKKGTRWSMRAELRLTHASGGAWSYPFVAPGEVWEKETAFEGAETCSGLVNHASSVIYGLTS